jgi:hypothetical protein
MRHAIATVLALVLTVSGPAPSPCRFSVGKCSLDRIVGYADRIVVARIDRIDEPAETPDVAPSIGKKLKLAHATVLETWKGPTDAPLVYRCSSSWTCDITSGEVGETAVLFLDPTSEAGYCMVADSGRGRLPIVEDGGEKLATMWVGDVELPLDTESMPGPDERYDFIRNVKLDTLRSVTKALVARHAKLTDMAARSDAIVVGKIRDEHRDRARILAVDGYTVEIEERWKGDIAESTFSLRPPKSWPTDVAGFGRGQRAVFLLTKARPDGKRDLVEDGRGRVLLDVDGEFHDAKIWIRDVEVPLPVRPVMVYDKGTKMTVDPLWGRVDRDELKKLLANGK